MLFPCALPVPQFSRKTVHTGRTVVVELREECVLETVDDAPAIITGGSTVPSKLKLRKTAKLPGWTQNPRNKIQTQKADTKLHRLRKLKDATLDLEHYISA